MSLAPEFEQSAAEGKRLFERKEYKAAAAAFEAAARVCLEKGDALLAAEMKNNQSVALLQARAFPAALDAVAGTDAVFAQAGDLKRQGMALANQAAVLEGLKKHADAAALYEQAAGILEKAGEGSLRADVMRSLATLKIRKGQGLDAVIAMQDGLSGVEKPSLKQRIIKALLKIRI